MSNLRRPPIPQFIQHLPPVQPVAPQGLQLPPVGDYESDYRRFISPDSTTSPLGIMPVLSTKRRWQSLDIYFVPSGPNVLVTSVSQIVSVGIFAKIQAERVLVGTGRYGFRLDAIGLPTRIASVRLPIAATFEIWFENTGAGGQKFELHYLATEQSNYGVEDFAGAIGIGNTSPEVMSGAVAASISTTASAFPYELLAVNALNAFAGVRYLHVHDLAQGGAFAGVAPRYAFGMPAQGNQVSDAGPMLRSRRFKNGVTLVGSTTAITTTAAGLGDVALNGWIR